jgi:Utp25, U3 small nucleolar RNA-associated SSU processome protein 25
VVDHHSQHVHLLWEDLAAPSISVTSTMMLHCLQRYCSSASLQWCLQAQHLFQKFDTPGAVEVADRRFQHFVKHLWPRVADARAPGVLLFASSYFDFVRLRNFLKAEGASFAVYCEYTSGPNVLRARMRFAQQERRILLFTERAHFYFRPNLRCDHASCAHVAVIAVHKFH